MAKYVTLVKQHLARFSAWKLEHVPQDFNERADALAAVAASLPITEIIFLPIYYQPDSSIATVPGKPGGRNLPFLDGPHSTVYQHGRTPEREGQGS